MPRHLIKILFLLLLSANSHATHIVGGELGYQYIEKNTDDNGITTYVYLITVRMNKDVNASGTLPDGVVLNVFNTANNFFVTQKSIVKVAQYPMPISTTLPCTVVPPGAAYEVGIYTDTIALEYSVEGYSLSTSSCCRLTGLVNTVNSINSGATYIAAIPPHNLADVNSTPVTNDSIKIICKDVPAYFNVPFYDADGDELSYEFCGAYDVDGNQPPYTSLKYAPGFSGANPLAGNPAITINPITGQVTGLVQQAGDYVVCFCVRETRAGVLINVYRKEFQYRVTECAAVSSLPEKYYSCKTLTLTFLNNNNPAYNYRWDFGVANQTNDTSNQRVPMFTYPDTGTYRIRLIVGRNQLCTDTSYSTVVAYPLVTAAFTVPLLRCSANPVLFTDVSTATYGIGARFRWFVQYPSTAPFKLADTVQNPVLYFGTRIGNDTIARVKLFVESSKGCIDSVTQVLPISQSPQLDAGPDLNFCLGDNAVINAGSSSTRIEWLPPSFLSDAFIIKPTASPPVTTTYRVLAQNAICTGSDTLTIYVTPKPMPNAGADTVLCFGGAAGLSGKGGQSFTWSPATGLNNALLRNPVASPVVSTTYILSVKDTLGCNRLFKDSVVVTVVPKLKIHAGRDTFVVLPNSIRLTATGAPAYQWSPAAFLDNANAASPVALINSTRLFTVRGYTPQGCEGYDSILVRVLLHEPDIYVPTAFSPNYNGLNDVLKPVGYGVEFLEIFAVYNRLGQQVYVTSTMGKGWDGTFNGKRQPEGTYVWHLKARDFRNIIIEKKGTTVLLR